MRNRRLSRIGVGVRWGSRFPARAWRGALAPALAAVALLAIAGPPTVLGQAVPRETAAPPELPTGRDGLVRIVHDPAARSLSFVIGPVRLMPGTPYVRLPVQMTSMPIDGWLHGFQVAMKDAEGLPLPGGRLHHVNFIDPDDRELFSPVARRVFAAGSHTRGVDLPGVIGYPVQLSDRLLIAAVFESPPEEEIAEAYLHVEFSYSQEGESLIEPRNVYPFHLDVMGFVGTRAFRVPPGRSMRSWQGSPAVEGRVLALGGHVHDFATRLRLVDVTTGAVLWDVRPSTDRDGRLAGLPVGEMWWGLGKRIAPDHVYRITVEYDNPLDVAAPEGGMGEIGGIILVRKGIAWPALDPTDPAYVRDLEETLAAPDRPAGALLLAP